MINELSLPFLKIHGCKNSFVVIHRAPVAHIDRSVLARRLCSIAEGLGTDGAMIVGDALPGRDDIEVEMFNPDGSPMGMCGNGIRSVSRFLYEEGITTSRTLSFSVQGRQIGCYSSDGGRSVRVDMGVPAFTPPDIPFLGEETTRTPLVVSGREFEGSLVSMGNPHVVIRLNDEEFERLELGKWGSLLEHHPLFPERTNVHFVRTLDRTRCEVKVWERGAGVTLACGTGACAVAVTGIREGILEKNVEVILPGGALLIEWGGDGESVFMTGPTEVICRGTIYGVLEERQYR